MNCPSAWCVFVVAVFMRSLALFTLFILYLFSPPPPSLPTYCRSGWAARRVPPVSVSPLSRHLSRLSASTLPSCIRYSIFIYSCIHSVARRYSFVSFVLAPCAILIMHSSPFFSFYHLQSHMPFMIRETGRKHQFTYAHATVWMRK